MATSTPELKGTGMLYVISKIASKDLDEDTYIKWYEDDHIAEIIQTSGINSALRYKSVDPKVEKPYMVTYPMENIAFTQGEEFKKIKVHSDMLPGGGPIYDLADIDVRYYGLTQVYDPMGPTQAGRVKTVLTAGLTPNGEITESEFDDWYRKEHLDKLAEVPGFIRTTRYTLLFYRTNAQSRELKGLPARAGDVEIAKPPKFFAIHEFDTDTVDMAAVMVTVQTEWSKKILGNLETPMESGMWSLKRSFGDKKFFQ